MLCKLWATPTPSSSACIVCWSGIWTLSEAFFWQPDSQLEMGLDYQTAHTHQSSLHWFKAGYSMDTRETLALAIRGHFKSVLCGVLFRKPCNAPVGQRQLELKKRKQMLQCALVQHAKYYNAYLATCNICNAYCAICTICYAAAQQRPITHISHFPLSKRGGTVHCALSIRGHTRLSIRGGATAPM